MSRITGIISVIGCWFITAGIAFIGTGIMVCLMYIGGVSVMIAGGAIAITLLVRSNIRFRNKEIEASSTESLFQTIITTEKFTEVWPLLKIYINEKQKMFLRFTADCDSDIIEGFYQRKKEITISFTKKVDYGERCIERTTSQTYAMYA